MPPLNMYVTQPVKVQTIENAVKVQCLQTGIVVLKNRRKCRKNNKICKPNKSTKKQ